MDWEKLDCSSSSFLRTALYSAIHNRFVCLLNTTLYCFEGVTPMVWEEFKDAASKGVYFNMYIKGRYVLSPEIPLKSNLPLVNS